MIDSGSGIDANKLEKIFERFYQAPSNSFNGSIGFGIGLNLCRMIVKLHHGTINACNRQDAQGSRFIIHIPYGKDHLKKPNGWMRKTKLPQESLLSWGFLKKVKKKRLRQETIKRIIGL